MFQQGFGRVKSSLAMKVFRKNGEVIDRGIISTRMVTDNFAELIIDALKGDSVGIGNFKYHDTGLGTTEEKTTDSGLETPTTVARVAGTQIEGDAPNVYKSVALITYDNTYAITEHGLFNAATDGVLMDRSVFAPENVQAGDQIEWTYLYTMIAGG